MQEKRVRRNAEEWRILIDQQPDSGLTVQAFCDEHDLTVSSFQAWKAKLRKSNTGIHHIKTNYSSSQPKISCELPSGLRLEWNEAVSSSSVISIIRGLA